MSVYWRPILCDDPVRPEAALVVAGGWTWATHAERIERGRERAVVPVSEMPDAVAEAVSAPRAPFAGIGMDAPRIMGILNATPDSFSDGGLHHGAEAAMARGREMIADGVEIVDIGGESTRPGADTVPAETETARVVPAIRALAGDAVLSIDTRKAAVAGAALAAGATIVNDVSAMTFDQGMAEAVRAATACVVLMHAQGDPKTMQDAPAYDDVLLDVFDFLAARIVAAEREGIPRARIAVDPGIGFGKTLEHNLALLAGLSLFHGLGCPILLGASRKRFIGTLSGAENAADRVAGSVGVALAAASQGVQVLRVHDTLATKQALALWRAARGQRGQ